MWSVGGASTKVPKYKRTRDRVLFLENSRRIFCIADVLKHGGGEKIQQKKKKQLK